MIRTVHPILFGDLNGKDEMGRACSRYGGERMCIQDFGVDTTWKIQALMGGYKMDL